jgi:hypothetical protein
MDEFLHRYHRGINDLKEARGAMIEFTPIGFQSAQGLVSLSS